MRYNSLHEAIKDNNFKWFKELLDNLEHNNLDINALESYQQYSAMKCTPLLRAILDNKSKYIIPLLNHGADANTAPVLTYACKKNKYKLAKLLLDRDADPDQENVLLSACYAANYKLVKLLLSRGSVPNQKDELFAACYKGSTKIAKLLLEAKCNPNQDGVLYAACRAGNTEMVKLLLSYGTTLNDSKSMDAQSLLMAAAKEHHKMVKLLVSSGVDLSVRIRWTIIYLLSIRRIIIQRCLNS